MGTLNDETTSSFSGRKHLRAWIGLCTTLSLAAITIFLPSVSARAETVKGYWTSNVSTVAQGGTVRFTLHPTVYDPTVWTDPTYDVRYDPTHPSYDSSLALPNPPIRDIRYFCSTQQASDTSNLADGASLTLLLVDSNSNILTTPNSKISGVSPLGFDWIFDGKGVGNFDPTESPYTGDLSFSFKIPNSVPAGDYQVALACISPSNAAIVMNGDYFRSDLLPLSVTAPGSESGTGPGSELARTGGEINITQSSTIATFLLSVGILLIVVTRLRKRKS